MSIRILAIASVFLLTAMPAFANTEYPMFRYDEQRTGNVTGNAPQTNQILWATHINGLIGSSPIISNGKIFVSNWFAEWYGGVKADNGLYCLNETTGEILWTNPLGGSGGASTAAVSGDKVFVGSLTGELYCINASTGETIWKKKIEHNPLWWGVASSPLVYAEKVFITTFSGNASNNGTLQVFDLAGTELWNSSSVGINNASFQYASPAAFGNYVLFAGNESSNHSLFCLNISDWNISWRFNTSAQIKSTPAISDNIIIFATDDKLYSVDNTSGKELWNKSLNCKMSSPAVAYGKVYIGSSDSRLYCYDANNGNETWNFTANGPIHSSPVVANNTVYFGTNTKNGTIYAVNATDGSFIWSYALNPPPGRYYNIMSSPAVSDEILFIGADDGRVYAFSHPRVNITSFSVESRSSGRGHSFTARLNITTSSDAPAGWYAVVVSGVNANGRSIAGIGTVYLDSNDAVDLMPVLIHVPSLAETGEYKLYAVIHRLNNYPDVLMDREGPVAVNVTL